MKRSCKPSTLNSWETNRKRLRANVITLQEIQEGNVDLFNPEIKKQTKNERKQWKIDYEQSYFKFSLDRDSKIMQITKMNSRLAASLAIARSIALLIAHYRT